MTTRSSVHLIDSSAWIEILRNRSENPLKMLIAQSLESKTAAMTEPVWFELSRGVRGKKEQSHLASLRHLCQWLSFDERCWEQATKLGIHCVRAGLNVPTGDLLVAACARRHSAKLIECDKHFRMIDQACPA